MPQAKATTNLGCFRIEVLLLAEGVGENFGASTRPAANGLNIGGDVFLDLVGTELGVAEVLMAVALEADPATSGHCFDLLTVKTEVAVVGLCLFFNGVAPACDQEVFLFSCVQLVQSPSGCGSRLWFDASELHQT